MFVSSSSSIQFGLSNRQIRRQRKKGQISPALAGRLLSVNSALRKNLKDYRLGLNALKRGETEIFVCGHKQTIRMFLTLCIQTIAGTRAQKKTLLKDHHLKPSDVLERNPLSLELKEAANQYGNECQKLAALPNKIYEKLSVSHHILTT